MASGLLVLICALYSDLSCKEIMIYSSENRKKSNIFLKCKSLFLCSLTLRLKNPFSVMLVSTKEAMTCKGQIAAWKDIPGRMVTVRLFSGYSFKPLLVQEAVFI